MRTLRPWMVMIAIGLVVSQAPALAQPASSGIQVRPFSSGSDYLSSAGYLKRVAVDLAPTGKLRVAMNMGLASLVTRDAATGELRGVAVELGRELASSLRVPFAPMPYPGLAAIVQTIKSKEWDIAFLSISAERAADTDFSAAYMLVDATYLVPAGSKVKTVPDADQPGIRIAVGARTGSDTFLTGAIKQAQLVRADTTPATFELLKSGQADVVAGERPALLGFAQSLPGSQVLSDRYLVLRQAIGVPKGHALGAAFVRTFIEQAKASGLVKRIIERSGLRGAEVAPPAGS